jgi:membrane protease YdiL (CAAX protease family)
MRSETNISRAFIDLSKIGRTDWRSVALTFLLVKFLALLFSVACVIAVMFPIFSAHRLFYIPIAVRTPIYVAVEATGDIFGLWLGCKFIMRRPFRSLISTNMTFDVRRCLLGAVLYLAANVVSLIAISLFFSIPAGSWQLPFGHFEWPHHNEQIVATMAYLFATPLVAFAEETIFRAWLTQTIGHYVRPIIVVVVLVAVLFAAYHTQYDLQLKALIFVNSIGFSALSLRDQRLELAIGVHLMINVCVTLQLLFFTRSQLHAQFLAPSLQFWALIILKGVLPFALIYGWLQKTRGWFISTDGRLASSNDVLETRVFKQ